MGDAPSIRPRCQLELRFFVAEQEHAISPLHQASRYCAAHAARAAKYDCFHASSARTLSWNIATGKLAVGALS